MSESKILTSDIEQIEKRLRLFDNHPPEEPELAQLFSDARVLLSIVKGQEAELPAVKSDVLDNWLKPMCSRLMYGRCTTLYCLKRGGYTGEPSDASIATCEAYESYNALSGQSDAASSMRSLCVEKVVSIPAKNIVRTTTEEVRGAASFKSDVLRALESVSIHGQEKQ